MLKEYGRGIQMVTRPVSALALELSLAPLTRMEEVNEVVNNEEDMRGVRRARDADDEGDVQGGGRRRLRLWDDLPYFEELHDDRLQTLYEHEAYCYPVRRTSRTCGGDSTRRSRSWRRSERRGSCLFRRSSRRIATQSRFPRRD